MDLEVAANYEEVNALPFVYLTGLPDGGVNGVERAMALSFHQLWYAYYETQLLRNPQRRCAS